MDYVEMNKEYLKNVEIYCNEKITKIEEQSFIQIQSDLVKRISLLMDAYSLNDNFEFGYQICNLITKLIRLGLMSGYPMKELLDDLHTTNLDDTPCVYLRKNQKFKLEVYEAHLNPTSSFEGIILSARQGENS
jgi:hypothetical protein